MPDGWKSYGKGPGTITQENGTLRITDQSGVNEWGIWKKFPVTAPGKYEIAVEISGRAEGAQIVLNAGKAVRVLPLETGREGSFSRCVLGIEVTEGVKEVILSIYSTYQGQADFLIRNCTFLPVKEFSVPPPLPMAAEPKPIIHLKNLHLQTPLQGIAVAPGNSPVLRAAADQLAREIGGEIVVPEKIKLPLERHVVVLGNRTNNDLIARLYLRGFCYTDLVYPGKGGSELRSIHNPTGGGFNVILCGGSDDAGAAEAASLLTREGQVAGHLMKIRAPGYEKPFNVYDPEHYYLTAPGGYYGWNYLSGIMALFYQTGDPFYAGEFLRLAFPDEVARKELQKFNPESIESLDDPLAGPYHYCAHQMILLWDLIEEHPVFTDEQRLAVTNALLRQRNHHLIWSRPAGKRLVSGSRHGQWADICLYVLGRYFNRDYPSLIWEDAIRRAEDDFRAASDCSGWIEGERGVLSWFVSGSITPAVNFFALAGGKPYNPDGALANAIRFMETQWDGSNRSEILSTASRQTFHLTAEHTGDGKFLWYADLLPHDTNKPHLGASFLPTGKIKKREPVELLNRWTAVPMKQGERDFFQVGISPEKLYLGLSWRDTLDTTGDWISFNCFNEEYRTAFKLLSLYGLRIDGTELLKGFGNYLQLYRNGTTAREIPTAGEVDSFGVVGENIFFSGSVPKHAFGAWNRELLLRRRSFALVADTVTPIEAGTPLTAVVNLQSAGPLRLNTTGEKLLFCAGNSLPIRQLKCSTSGNFPISHGQNNTLFETAAPGDRAIVEFPLSTTFEGEILLHLNAHNSRAGTVNLYLDGEKVAKNIPHFIPENALSLRSISLGQHRLSPGTHRLEIEVATRSSLSSTAWIGAGQIELRSDTGNIFSATSPGTKCLLRSGNDATLTRLLPANSNRPVTTFTLLHRESSSFPIRGSILADRAALFEVPEKILAFTGNYPPFGNGSLVMLEENRASGTGITSLLTLLECEQPVQIDWIYGNVLILNGKPGTHGKFAGTVFTLPRSGRLTLPAPHRPYFKWPQLPTPAATTAIKSHFSASWELTELAFFPEKPRFLTPTAEGFLAGAGNTLYLLHSDGRIAGQFPLSAPVLCAVQNGEQLVVGTQDEKITAFSSNGEKCWSFTSCLAPEIEATRKYYWFKSAYPGVFSLAIHGDRIFAGSACTMEILKSDGSLAARHPQPWGPCRDIEILSRADGSYRAIGLRTDATDGLNLWSVDSKTGTNVSTFDRNVHGYKEFPGFGSMYRTKMFAADFDGDGNCELLTDAQGMYCWLNLYDTEGNPLRQINLGPGDRNMGKVIVDWTVGEFIGDTRPEAILATTRNQLVAIDGKCTPLWSVDLPFRPQFVAVDEKNHSIATAGERKFALYNGAGGLIAETELALPCEGLAIRDGRILVRSGKRLLELHRPQK